MKTREIGNSKIQASAVALGCWAIGGTWWGGADDRESVRTIQAAIDAGISMIDTAPVYGFGRSESVVGRAIQGRRDQVIVATKCGLVWEREGTSTHYMEVEGRRICRCLLPESIALEVEASLKRLGTDYIDLYQTHWQAHEPDKDPVCDTMACLLKLKEQGKIRAIGASNVTVNHIREYMQVGPLDAIQPRYSILDRAIETEIMPFCCEQNISILAYSPMENGLLTGKVGMDRTFAKGDIRNDRPWFRPENRARVIAMLDRWQDLTKKYGCTPAQLVIAWTIAQPSLTFALTGARHPGQARDNAAAGSLELEPGDIARMRKDAEELGGADQAAG